MQGGAAVQSMADGAQQHGIFLEASVLYGRVQPHVILKHSASGTQIGVPRFRVAGLALAQAHIGPGGVEAAPGLPGQQAVPVGGVGQMDGVSLVAGAEAPARRR